MGLGETAEKQVTVGFRMPQVWCEIIDILCRSDDLNRSQFFRRALDAYEPMRTAIAEFERETRSDSAAP
jgi:hypothetical protein